MEFHAFHGDSAIWRFGVNPSYPYDPSSPLAGDWVVGPILLDVWLVSATMRHSGCDPGVSGLPLPKLTRGLVAMAGMVVLGLILRWLHILSAIALMGGALFQRLVLLPSAESLPGEAHEQLKAAVRGRWSRVVMTSAGLLLLSGLLNFGILIVAYQLDKSTLVGGKYHMLFGIKFLLALVVLYIASMLAGRSSLAERARQNARFWLNLNLVLATAVVCLGGVLRQADRTLKSDAPASTVTDLSSTDNP